jgi:hypothetical protein
LIDFVAGNGIALAAVALIRVTEQNSICAPWKFTFNYLKALANNLDRELKELTKQSRSAVRRLHPK